MEPHRSISQEEYDAWVEKAHAPEPGKTLVETPAEQTKEVEQLLSLPAGSFGKSYITILGDSKACSTCNRQTSFLDIVNDGAAFHGKEFVKDIVQGKRGIVYNPNAPRPHKCFGCAAPSSVRVTAYSCGAYSCGA